MCFITTNFKSMMNSLYTKPEVAVLDIAVERGFALSDEYGQTGMAGLYFDVYDAGTF